MLWERVGLRLVIRNFNRYDLTDKYLKHQKKPYAVAGLGVAASHTYIRNKNKFSWFTLVLNTATVFVYGVCKK